MATREDGRVDDKRCSRSWTVRAAMEADVRTLAVLTGGFAAEELHDAGAAAVFESVDELRARIEDTELR